jgi:hypothetical protein
MTKHFDIYVVLYMSQQMKNEIMAVGYHIGKRGEMGVVSRRFIQEGLDRYKNGLSPKDKAVFEEILANVTLKATLNPPAPRKPGPYKYVKKKLRGGI